MESDEQTTASEDTRAGRARGFEPELVERTAQAILAVEESTALELVRDLHPADLARLIGRLDRASASTLFAWLPEQVASDTLPELEEDLRAGLLGDVSPARITEIVDELDTDDAADVLGNLPDEVVEDILPHLEDGAELKNLLAYGEDSAGGIMATELVAVPETASVGEATEIVRSLAEEVEPVYRVYAIDRDHRLTGVVRPTQLLLSPTTALIRDIMDPDVTTIMPEADQEEAALLMERYDLIALPVVDEERRLLGRITIDDIVDVIREEAEEDLHRMSGLADEELSDPVWKVSAGRLVWLATGLVGALLSSFVIHRFEQVLERAVVLAVFIPVVMSMAGNAGIQSSAMAVQGLATGDLWLSDLPKRLRKEILVALVNAVMLALLFGILVRLLETAGLFESGVQDPWMLTLTVALSLATVIVLAAMIGTTVPLLLHRFKIDPALASGPFITTSNDILGLVVYFLVATHLYLV